MRAATTGKYPLYSSSYLVSFDGGELPVKRRGLLWRLGRFLFDIPGRIWRVICFKVILITILSMFCGIVVGAVWMSYEADSYEEYESRIDWLLYEAEI
jgi:hypothetical protein